jgi:phosphatidylglycerophosphate synthase
MDAVAPKGIVLALPVPGAAPLDRLAGLGLALRATLTVKKERCAPLALVVADDAVGAAVAGDARVGAIEVVRGAAVGALREAAGDGPFVLALHHRLVDPSVYRALREATLGPAEVAVVATADGRAIGPVLGSPSFLDAIASSDGPLADRVLAAADALVASGRARSLDVEGHWHARADEPAGRRRAFDALFDACRKSVDGLVSRHLNRHVSIAISKRIVETGLTPNMTSVITFFFALGGAACVAQGSYAGLLAGAFLFQWNSILDGVDGELARVRFQQSKLGQWIDTVADDVSSLVFYGGLAIGCAAHPHARWLQGAAAIAMVSLVGMAAQYYVELARLGSGDFYSLEWGFQKAPKKTFLERAAEGIALLLKKDFFIFLYLVMAVFGVLPWALPIAALGHAVAFGAATSRTIGRALRRGRPAT